MFIKCFNYYKAVLWPTKVSIHSHFSAEDLDRVPHIYSRVNVLPGAMNHDAELVQRIHSNFWLIFDLIENDIELLDQYPGLEIYQLMEAKYSGINAEGKWTPRVISYLCLRNPCSVQDIFWPKGYIGIECLYSSEITAFASSWT